MIRSLPSPLQRKILYGAEGRALLFHAESLVPFWQTGWQAFGINETDFQRALGNLRIYWERNENQCCLGWDLVFRGISFVISSANYQTPEAEKHILASTALNFLLMLDEIFLFHQAHPNAAQKKLVELRI